jgi:hypothetical protein
LLALEKQEAAFLFYFALPMNTASVIAQSEETISPVEEQLESTVEKSAANQKEFPRSYNYTMLSQSQVEVYSLTSDFNYRVQVGAFKQFPSVYLAKKYKLNAKKLKYKDLSVFYAGDFKSFEAINYVLDDVRAKGYKDAFIICYINGKVCSSVQAQDAVKKNKELYTKYLDAAKFELLGLKSGKSYYDIYPKEQEETAKKEVATQSTSTKVTVTKTGITGQVGLAFYVQLGSFSKPEVPAIFKAYMPLSIVKKSSGTYGILKGPFANYNEALSEQNDLKSKGLKDAYIVSYKDGKAVELNKAIKMQNTAAKATTTKTEVSENAVNETAKSSGKIAYRLQVAAYKGSIPADLQKKLDLVAQSKPVEKFLQKDGLTIYTVGYFTNYKSASAARNELKKYEINDSFVVAFRGDEKITLSEAKNK